MTRIRDNGKEAGFPSKRDCAFCPSRPTTERDSGSPNVPTLFLPKHSDQLQHTARQNGHNRSIVSPVNVLYPPKTNPNLAE
jgi:hypothetical protein